MRYIKYFEALTKDGLEDFCKDNLVWLLDDPTFSFSVKRDSYAMVDDLKRAMIDNNFYVKNKKGQQKYQLSGEQSVVLKPNGRTHTILIERKKVKKVRTYYPWDEGERVMPFAFSWDNVKDDIIPLIDRLERNKHVVRNICLLDDKGNPRSFGRELLEKSLPYKITKIYITITK